MGIMAGERKEGHRHLLNAESVSWSSPEIKPTKPTLSPLCLLMCARGCQLPALRCRLCPIGNSWSTEPLTLPCTIELSLPDLLNRTWMLCSVPVLQPLPNHSPTRILKPTIAFTNSLFTGRDLLGQEKRAEHKVFIPTSLNSAFPLHSQHPLHS